MSLVIGKVEIRPSRFLPEGTEAIEFKPGELGMIGDFDHVETVIAVTPEIFNGILKHYGFKVT